MVARGVKRQFLSPSCPDLYGSELALPGLGNGIDGSPTGGGGVNYVPGVAGGGPETAFPTANVQLRGQAGPGDSKPNTTVAFDDHFGKQQISDQRLPEPRATWGFDGYSRPAADIHYHPTTDRSGRDFYLTPRLLNEKPLRVHALGL